MSEQIQNRATLAISLAVCLLLAFSVALSGHHSHGDGRAHNDCAACLWANEAIAVAALFCFFVSRILIGIVSPLEVPFRPVLLLFERNGRAPPSSLA